MHRFQDALAILKGLQMIAEAGVKLAGNELKRQWTNSSVRHVLEENVTIAQNRVSEVVKNPKDEFENLVKNIRETSERMYTTAEGLRQYSQTESIRKKSNGSPGNETEPAPSQSVDIPSITLKELQNILSQRDKIIDFRDAIPNQESATDPDNINPLKMEVARLDPNSFTKDEKYIQDWMKYIAKTENHSVKKVIETNLAENTAKSILEVHSPKSPIKLPELSVVAKQRRVPSSRIGRLASFGQLFAGLGVGTVNELTKGALGLGGAKSVKEALLSPNNAQRIVDTLCKVRGAALKIGQILSIQDSNVVSPELAKAFERVRQAADYMPDWQVEKVLSSELGPNWRSQLKSFDLKPFAAASIGQVHRGVSLDGTELAIKVQYPGVAKSIESDIDNLVSLLKIWDVFPPGIFIDSIVKVAKRELSWEVDYKRESEYTKNFGFMVAKYPEYRVPKVIDELTTGSIITTELVPGIPVDKCFDISYENRKFIGESIFKLCLRELFEFRCMQTDPNWSNFLFDEKSKRLMLIDFGSTRFYTDKFIANYRRVIQAALKDDRETVLEISRQMGFLTGYETKQMENAHVNAVMILGEMFSFDGEFDFGKQETIKRIAELVPVMIAHRLCPPPEEIYSIHRKLSGVFLLCSRLNIKFDCRPYFHQIVNR